MGLKVCTTTPSFYLLPFFLVELGFGLSSFALAKQNRYSYHLSHTSSPFFSGYFGDGVS
jgi:hypothetical protein